MAGLTRALAAHESGHAITAAYFGAHVVSVAIERGQGATVHHGATVPAAAAVITAAGAVAQRLAGLETIDLSCGDLAAFEAEHGGFAGLYEAERRAQVILTRHTRAWRALAARLERERRIEF